MPFWILTELLTGTPEGAAIPMALLIINGVVNFFVVEASVDHDSIYIKQWIKEVQYPLSQLDKVGELKDGVTRITILNNNKVERNYIILNVRDSFISQDSANVYELLLKLKANFKKQQQ
ncbi:hypothetical protein [Reichenbachiella sp.]